MSFWISGYVPVVYPRFFFIIANDTSLCCCRLYNVAKYNVISE